MATPSKATVVFRIRGIPYSASDDEVIEALRSALKEDEKDTEFDLELMPDPSHSFQLEEDLSIGLISFKPTHPAFADPLFAGKEHSQFETPLGDFTIDKNFEGLTQLYNNPEGVTIKADIIAVTGLDGHGYGSFRGRGNLGRMWLRDFFKTDFPDCRTMVWGYNSKLTSESSVHEIKDYNTAFLAEIDDSRADKTRPIIFIGHSFGGIIIQQSLVAAKEAEDRGAAGPYSIFASTIALLFFGTPHRGLITADIRSMISEESGRASLLDALDESTGKLTDTLERFIQFASRFKIFSFYEVRRTKTLLQDENGKWSRSGKEALPVGPESAVLHLPPDVETKYPVDQDHSNIVKFDFKQDPTYKFVFQKLCELLRTLKGDENSLTGAENNDASLPKLRTFAPPDHDRPELPIRKKSWKQRAPAELFTAVELRDLDEIRKLLEAGANPEFPRSSDSKTAMYLAVKRGYAAGAKLFLEAGCDPNYVHPGRDYTLLVAAAEEKHTDVVRVLLDYGAEPDYEKGGEITVPLYTAVQNNDVQMVNDLLSYGANTGVRFCGHTALQQAAVKGLGDIATLLLKFGADPNERIDDSTRMEDDSPLNRSMGFAERFVLSGALELTARYVSSSVGETALHCALRRGKTRMVELLLEHNADPDLVGVEGVTPLMRAVLKEEYTAIKLLKDAKADPEIKDNEGRGLKDVAGSPKMKKFLKDLGLITLEDEPEEAGMNLLGRASKTKFWSSWGS